MAGLEDVAGGGGGVAGPQEVEIGSWPSTPLNVVVSDLLKLADNIGKNRGYDREGFIQQCAMQLYSATNFEGKNPTTEANRCVQYAKILAQILGL